MTYAELSEAQARRSRQFAEAQTDAMSVYCDAERDLKDLQAENAKLRKVANLISEYISYDRCEGCVVKTACNSHELDVCWMVTELRNQLRKLGVEVDG